MCDPVTLIGMALSAGGGYIQSQQNADYVDATNKANKGAYKVARDARTAEQDRQRGFEEEAAARWNQTTDKMGADDYGAQSDADVAKYLEEYDSTGSPVPTGFALPGQENASEAVKSVIASKANAASAEARTRIQALAKLTANGSVGTGRSNELRGSGDVLSLLNGLLRGSLGVGNQEQSIGSAQVTKGDGTLADVMSGAGALVTGSTGAGGLFGPKVPAGNSMLSPLATAAIKAGRGGLY